MLLQNGMIGREDFNNAVAVFQNAFPGMNVVEQFQLTQSTLRLEQPLVANQNAYRFPVMTVQQQAGGVVFNTEIRLNMQDTFVPTHCALYLAAPGSTTAANFRLFSNPNQNVFANALQYRALYNGTMGISVNKKQFITNWSLHKHNIYPFTQQTAAFGAGSPEDQMNHSDCAFPVQPFVMFGGAQNVEIFFQLAAGPTAVTATDRFVLIFDGVLGQNSTPVS